jgi:hypothetical protein
MYLVKLLFYIHMNFNSTRSLFCNDYEIMDIQS